MTDPLEQSVREAVARSLADGHTGCSGGCRNRPCEVDFNSADAITAEILAAVRSEMVPATFAGLLQILDTWYPADVFTGSTEDVGVRCVVLARELAALRSQPVTEMRMLGDRMQSEGSRLAEWVLSSKGAPHEALMAAAQMRSDVDRWTELRRSEAGAHDRSA